jgi:hypothetical protein
MPTNQVSLGDNRLSMWWSNWNGRERMEHNGIAVSEKRNLTRFVSPHEFTVEENGQPVKYDVRFTGYMGHVIRRNGEVVAERHRPIARYFLAFGLLAVAVIVLSLIASGLAALGIVPDDLDSSIETGGVVAAFVGAFILAATFKRQLMRP